jgi:hypothetical protein
MDIAFSTTQNKNIHATDEHLRKTSNYWSLGLRCPECSEPVYWKTGGYSSAPHFAHFHSTSFSYKCSLRIEKPSFSAGGNSPNTDYSLLLKDIQTQLIEFIANPSVFGYLNIDLNDEIVLNDAEQRTINLIQCRNIFSMYYEAYEQCKQENSIENPFDPDDPFAMFYFARGEQFLRNYFNTNKEIGLQIAIFLGKQSNSIILYNLVRIFMKKVLVDFPSQDPALNTRSYVFKAIARKDWQSILPGQDEFGLSSGTTFQRI